MATMARAPTPISATLFFGLEGTASGTLSAAVADCSAATKASAPAKRSAGAFARAASTALSMATGTVSRSVRRLGGRSVISFAMIDCEVGPEYGGSPASISYSTLARL